MKRNNWVFTCAAAILLVLTLVSLFSGKYPLSLSGLLAGEKDQLRIFLTLRLSRTAVAVIGGFILGMTGFVYQTVFRNPLASPDVIGVSSGASAGAAAGLLFFGTAAVTLTAFAGALAAVAAAMLLAAADRSSRKSTMVLAGIAVHALAQTALMALKLTADPERQLASIEYWIMGSLSDISAYGIGWNLILGAACVPVLFALHRHCLLLSMDEGEARTLGVPVNGMRMAILATATLAVSSVISLTGLVSFIGLLAPHGARLIEKDNRMPTMVLSGLIGSILLCGADILAKTVSAGELPVSLFTSLLGAPLLMILSVRKGLEE